MANISNFITDCLDKDLLSEDAENKLKVYIYKIKSWVKSLDAVVSKTPKTGYKAATGTKKQAGLQRSINILQKRLKDTEYEDRDRKKALDLIKEMETDFEDLKTKGIGYGKVLRKYEKRANQMIRTLTSSYNKIEKTLKDFKIKQKGFEKSLTKDLKKSDSQMAKDKKRTKEFSEYDKNRKERLKDIDKNIKGGVEKFKSKRQKSKEKLQDKIAYRKKWGERVKGYTPKDKE